MVDKSVLDHVARIVGAYVSHHKVTSEQLPEIVQAVFSALSAAAHPGLSPEPEVVLPHHPHVTPDYIVSLETGRRLRTLKRYLMATHGLTPEAYRRKWRLPDDYPMVAPNYSLMRRSIAISNGLGRHPQS